MYHSIVDYLFEDFHGQTDQRYRPAVVGVGRVFARFWDRNHVDLAKFRWDVPAAEHMIEKPDEEGVKAREVAGKLQRQIIISGSLA